MLAGPHSLCVSPPLALSSRKPVPRSFLALGIFGDQSTEASACQWLLLSFVITLTLYGDCVTCPGRRRKEAWALEISKAGEGEVFPAAGRGRAGGLCGCGGTSCQAHPGPSSHSSPRFPPPEGRSASATAPASGGTRAGGVGGALPWLV